MHAHSTIYEFELTRVDKLFDFKFHSFTLLPSPSLEKCHFNIYKLAVLILQECGHHRIKHVLHTCTTNGVVGSDIVLIDGFKPTNIIVRVRNQVNIDFVGDDSVCSVVLSCST